jgi:ppGpp synthetase/RelA/SpoT-type nucleotidyltranferase
VSSGLEIGAQASNLIEEILAEYDANLGTVALFQQQLYAAVSSSVALEPHIHSIRVRLKDRDHLRDKLERKYREQAEGDEPFEVTPANLLVKINDLAGMRILHLYTRQIREIDAALQGIFAEQRYDLIEGPFARTWDDESREFFQECGIATQVSPTLYTSVHYVVSSASRTTVTCEVQVRTLMEEVWGEVDHSINYPIPTEILASQEQLKVLARVTSSASRLVDSIFLTHESAMEDSSSDRSA